MDTYISVLKKYCVFSGRASRKEFWMFYLFNVIIGAILSLIVYFVPNLSILASIYSLAILLPNLGVTIRRLHDIGKSWPWIFIVFIPIAGIIWFIVLLAKAGTIGDNEFGPQPTE